jgi:hypothetical protein
MDGAVVELLATVMVALAAPVAVGAKATFKVVD